jgi:hypothetical protein
MYTWRDMHSTPDLRELDNPRELASYAIQSQYSASPKILALAAGFQDRLGPEADVDLFYRAMFNIHTAQGAGLDNWGVILGIGRGIPGPYTEDCFGFAGSELAPFDRLPFVPDGASPQHVILLRLSDDLYRLLLLYKALANISPATAEAQNRLLATLVGSGIGGLPRAAYVLEADAMVIRWVFAGPLTTPQRAVFMAAGPLARGAGVGWELYAVDPSATFGFGGGDWQPFNQAPFAGDNSLRIFRS